MPYNFRKFDPQQLLLLPPNLDDWLPQQHLARFLADVVANLDLRVSKLWLLLAIHLALLLGIVRSFSKSQRMPIGAKPKARESLM